MIALAPVEEDHSRSGGFTPISGRASRHPSRPGRDTRQFHSRLAVRKLAVMSLTNASVNPARSTGPALFRQGRRMPSRQLKIKRDTRRSISLPGASRGRSSDCRCQAFARRCGVIRPAALAVDVLTRSNPRGSIARCANQRGVCFCECTGLGVAKIGKQDGPARSHDGASGQPSVQVRKLAVRNSPEDTQHNIEPGFVPFQRSRGSS
jgi:hypothetical protein